MGTLSGRRVVVTRRSGQASSLIQQLQARGATVVEVPSIEIVPPSDVAPLDRALRSLAGYQWVVFTSANAVQAVLGRLTVLGLPPRLAPARVASLGPATTSAVRQAFPADPVALEPEGDFRATGLADAFARGGGRGARVLFPASSQAREELQLELRKLGAEVDVIEAYATHEPADLVPRVRACLEAGFDLLTFASPSAASAFAAAAGGRQRGLPAVVIGPTTARAAQAAGFELRGTAQPSTTEGLVDAVEQAFLTRSH